MKQSYNKLLVVNRLCLAVCIVSSTPIWAKGLNFSCPKSLYIPEYINNNRLTTNNIEISADAIELKPTGISELFGDVNLVHKDKQIRADFIQYNKSNNSAHIHGGIQYWDSDIYIEADSAEIDFSQDTSQLKQAKYKIKGHFAHGQSHEISSQSGVETHLQNATYSSCDPQNKFWELSANELSFDHTKNWGYARDVLFKIKNIPVFYSPYISFPLSDKRKTGFLIPQIGHSNRNGNEVTIPFYWNIKPYIDATLTPRIFTKNDLMIAGAIRHISEDSKLKVSFEYLSNNDHRNLHQLQYMHKLADKGHFLLDYNYVSDNRYFEDFGTDIDTTSTRFLDQRAELTYQENWWESSIRFDAYQITDQTIANQQYYERLPQISFNAYSPYTAKKLHYTLHSELIYFDTDSVNNNMNHTTGSRLNLNIAISYPYQTNAIFISPRLDFHYTQYNLKNTAQLTSNPNPNRFIPLLSIDNSMYFEREFVVLERKFFQMLEPRLFYLYVPEKKQNDLPIFDTDLYDLSFDHLFRRNRFSGSDRIGDANFLTLALHSSLIDDNTEREIGYINLGQSYYLSRHKINLPNRKTMQKKRSAVITELGANLSQRWQLKGKLHWEQHNNNNKKLLIQTQYKIGSNQLINFAYRLNNVDPTAPNIPIDVEQIDISFHWPLQKNWDITGLLNYGFKNDTALDNFIGIGYSNCCWGVKATARRFIADANGISDTNLFLEFELKNIFTSAHDTIR